MPAAIKKAIHGEKDEGADWTINTLRIHLLTIIESLAEVTNERFTAQKEAVDRALVETNHRFESVNEFRGQLTDNAATFVTRNEAQLQYNELSKRIDSNSDKTNQVSSRLDRIEGSGSGLKQGWGYLVGGIGALAVIITAVIELINHAAK